MKNRVTPILNPGKWKHGLTPAVPWWLNVDPYSFGSVASNARRVMGRGESCEQIGGAKL